MHPSGNAPTHAANARGNQITKGNCHFKQDLHNFQLYSNLQSTLKHQIIAMVKFDFLRILEDPDFCFTNVLPFTMLEHLKTSYGTISCYDIEGNRNKSSIVLNVDDPIEVLWISLQEIQCFTQAGNNKPISNNMVIRLTLPLFELTCIFGAVTEKWCDHPHNKWAFAKFKLHF
jgi:hypothetical protein